MAGISLSQAQTQLDQWLAAATAIASGQSYSIAGRSVTNADLKDVQESIIFWNSQVKSLSSGKSKIKLWGASAY